MILSSICLIYLGLISLSLVLKKHYKEIIKKDSDTWIRVLLSIVGVALLATAQVFLIKIFGVSLGLTYAVGLIGIIIVFIAMLYTYIPKIIISFSIYVLLMTLILTLV